MRFPPILVALVGCAMAIGASSTAAKPTKQKIARCVKYSQARGADEQSVDVGLRNRCRFDVACTVEWKISCDGDDAGTVREQARNVSLDRGAREIITASATVCGDESWAVDDIRWTCEPR
jgi:hypothetical protein